jgi:isoprenylcysteine carboxyl methyltransferase (ICMT) family protein YpbQ
MTITTVLAYILIACYFVMERSLRKGTQALNLKPGAADAGSSQVLWVSGVISILLVIAAPVLNTYQIGEWSYAMVGWLGLIVMLSGLAMRYWAAKTLGEFYTRTLQVIEGQKIVSQAPYNVIRHPGYLGTLLMVSRISRIPRPSRRVRRILGDQMAIERLIRCSNAALC